MSVESGHLQPDPVRFVTKHLQQRIECGHFPLKKYVPKIGGFQSFKTARRKVVDFQAMLWLKKGFSLSRGWTSNDQNDLLAHLFGPQTVSTAWNL